MSEEWIKKILKKVELANKPKKDEIFFKKCIDCEDTFDEKYIDKDDRCTRCASNFAFNKIN